MAAHQAVRRWILTGAVAAITITGTFYGAGLKSDQELKQKKRELLQTTPEEMIAQLEGARTELVSRKNELERKIERFSERRRQEDLSGKDTK